MNTVTDLVTVFAILVRYTDGDTYVKTTPDTIQVHNLSLIESKDDLIMLNSVGFISKCGTEFTYYT